jgi:hypothetical protein
VGMRYRCSCWMRIRLPAGSRKAELLDDFGLASLKVGLQPLKGGTAPYRIEPRNAFPPIVRGMKSPDAGYHERNRPWWTGAILA